MKKLISLFFIALLTVVGCSSVTPAPEIIITKISPASGGGVLAVTLENKNYVDAIITKLTLTFTDTIGTSGIVTNQEIAGYIVGGGTYLCTFTPSYPALGGVGSGTTVVATFSGTDSYGYNKTFTVSTPKLAY